MLTPEQLRAARALLDWTRAELADKSGVNENTIKHFERGDSDPKQSTILKWQRALKAGGVVFLDPDDAAGAGPGVRLKVGRAKR